MSDYSGGEPTFDSMSGLLGGVNLVRTVVGTTGGDSDLTCDTSDKIGNALSGVENLDCTPPPVHERPSSRRIGHCTGQNGHLSVCPQQQC
ncbi:hypothetical protein C8039_12025 [Halogeometricum sp. wsp3]|nr:hypothetical protein C8039_12025 [Halogeometricum sp. wsp3]